MPPPFEAAHIKLARANKHIAELASKVDAFLSPENVYVSLEIADEMKPVGWEVSAFVYRQREPTSTEWSAIVGDAIHNMRAALDLIVSELHRTTGGDPKDTRHVYYPFCKSKDKLSDTIRSTRLHRIGREFLDLIAETAPYRGGNDGLRAIHDLDILDKHQSLVTTVSIVAMDWPVPVNDGSRFVSGVAQDGQRLVMMPRAFCKSIPIGTRIKADLQVVFGEVGFFMGRDVVVQLRSCAAGVANIITRFAAIVDSKAQNTNILG